MRKLITLSLFCFSCGVDSNLDQQEGGNEAHAGPSDDSASTGQAITGHVCPTGPTVKGIDVSTYQGGSINWGAVKGAGYAFAIARVSDGTNYPDGTFAGNWARMRAAGVIRGAYQYFEPGQDPTAQANLVIARVGRLGDGDLPVMLDVEATGGQSAATLTAHIHTWVNAIKAGTGKEPMIYTGAYFWDASVHSADFASLPLNVAWYGTTCPGEPSAWSGHAWTFHQYTDADNVPGVPGGVDADVFNGSLAALQAFAGTAAPEDCRRSAGGFTFSCNGPQAGEVCVQIDEPADPNTWNDNFLCSKVNLGIKWSHAGTLAGMRCTQIAEPADPHTWNDNYLCVPEVSPYHFTWSSAGPIAGHTCVQFNEPADYADTWNDNFLCFDDAEQERQTRGPFTWSSAGPVAGKACTPISEPADPDTWGDNYFCSDVSLGMRWSSAGPIAGMTCTQTTEGSDPHTWNDNYLCLPPGSPYTFKWSSAGPLNPDDRCIAWYEAADPNTWNDNYVCW